MEHLTVDIDHSNYGMLSSTSVGWDTIIFLRNHKITFTDSYVLQNGNPIYKINRRYAAKKRNGMYKELKPTLTPIVEDNP